MDNLNVILDLAISKWTVLFILATANERVVEFFVGVYETKTKKKMGKYAPQLLSVLTAFGLCYSANITLLSKAVSMNAYVNIGLASVVVSLGSVFVHDSLGLLKALKEMFKTQTVMTKDYVDNTMRKKF